MKRTVINVGKRAVTSVTLTAKEETDARTQSAKNSELADVLATKQARFEFIKETLTTAALTGKAIDSALASEYETFKAEGL